MRSLDARRAEAISESLAAATTMMLEGPAPETQEYKAGIGTLYDALKAASNEDAVSDYSDPIRTDKGVAVSPFRAGVCLLDFERTAVFSRGAVQATREQVARSANGSANILYAGSGPFGSLVLPLTKRFSPDEIKILALDINPISTENLLRLIRLLDIEDYFVGVATKNACTFDPQSFVPDVVISETMCRALISEPYCSIAKHMVQFLGEDGLLLPEEVKVSLSALVVNEGPNDRKTSKRISLGDVVVFNREYLANRENEDEMFFNVTFEIPPELYESDYVWFSLDTEVKVFGDNILKHSSSDITLPIRLGMVEKVDRKFKFVSVKYKPGCDWNDVEMHVF